MHLILETIVTICQLLWICLMSLMKWITPTTYKSVKGEVCLVTGGGSGIGRLMALEFARRGAVMILWDINEEGNKETAQMVTSAGGKAFTDKCDVSNREEVHEAAERARRVVSGDITMLINNAGVVYGKEFMEMTDEEVQKTMNINSLAHMWLVREFMPAMTRENHGHIITIASVVGLFAAPCLAYYCASKHAAVGFHNGMELELRRQKKDGVRTTLVCPYHVKTGMFSGIRVRFPNLISSLEPEECVEAVMHAVLTDQPMVAIPRMMYFMHYITTCLPHKAALLLNEFMGTFQSMDKFVPTRNYQKKAAENGTS